MSKKVARDSNYSTTVEKDDAGTLGRRLGSLGFSCTRRQHLGYVSVYSNGKFTPAGLPRYPRRDVTDSVILMLVGKIIVRLYIPHSGKFGGDEMAQNVGFLILAIY